jgi:hypothetical protein
MLPLLPAVLALFGTTTTPARSAPSLQPPSACQALTIKEVESAIGRTITGTANRSVTRGSTCDWSSGEAVVTLTVRRTAAKLDLPAEVGNLRDSFPEAGLRSVEGLGGAAILVDLGDSGALLNIFRNDHEYLLVAVLGFGDSSKASTAAVSIARRAIGRL